MEGHAFNTFRAWTGRIIKRVANNWMIKVFHMHADLVRATGFGLNFKISKFNSIICKSFQYFVFRNSVTHCPSRTTARKPATEVGRTAANGLVYNLMVAGNKAGYYGIVNFLYCSSLKLAFE